MEKVIVLSLVSFLSALFVTDLERLESLEWKLEILGSTKAKLIIFEIFLKIGITTDIVTKLIKPLKERHRIK